MRTTAAVATLLLFTSCTGTAEDAGTSAPRPSSGRPGMVAAQPGPATGSTAANPANTPAAPAGCSAASAPLAARVRRLTQNEYSSSVKDLLGETVSPSDLPTDTASNGFLDNVLGSLGVIDLGKYLGVAQALGGKIARKAAMLAPCTAGMAEASCADKFITDFGLRILRQPVSDDQRARYRTLFANARAAGDYASAIGNLVAALLMSPHFLYRVEIGGGGALDAFETATALSFLLTGSTPDAALLAAAANGSLSKPAEIEAHAKRLLDGSSGSEALRDFFVQWLRLDELLTIAKSPTTYPQFTPAVAAAMRAELTDFATTVVWKGERTLRSLITSPAALVPPVLAPLLGLKAQAGAVPGPVQLPAAERAGMLTRPGVLALLAHDEGPAPVLRGVFVARKLFCFALPPPPPDAAMAQQAMKGVSERDLAAQRAANSQCAGCHQVIDAIGFGFDGYDGIGRFRTAADTRGTVKVGSDVDGPFMGVADLDDKLGASADVRECFFNQFAGYALADVQADRCRFPAERARFGISGGDLRELIIAVAASPAFRARASTR